MTDTETVRVEVVADWLTFATAGSTVLAAALAAGSIIYARRQADRAQKALLRERRADFELGILAEMSRQFDTTQTNHLRGYLLALIRPGAADDDLPALRNYMGHLPTDLGTKKLATVRESTVREAPLNNLFTAEIQEAIERRLRDRND